MKTVFLNSAAAAALVLGMSVAAVAQTGGSSGGSMGGEGGTQMRPPAAGVPAPEGEMKGGAQGELKGDTKGSVQRELKGETKGSAQGEMKPETKGSAQGEMKSDTKGTAAGETKGDMKSGRAAASKELSTEQRTTIREKLVSRDVDRVKADFNVSVGVVVPRTIRVRPLPVEIVEIVPEYRGYDYIVLADGRILIIDPASYEVVTVLRV